MSRITFPRYTLRHRKAGRRPGSRRLLLEQLSQRLVLTGGPEVVASELVEPIVESLPTLADSTATEVVASDVAPVYLDTEGVVHVQPASPQTNIVVRQFVNYQLQEVVEVEAAGEWTAFPVEQVQAVQIHQLGATQPVVVDAGVTVSVTQLTPTAVDAAFAANESDSLVAEPLVGDPPVESGPGGTDPGGVDPDPAPCPPTIDSFTATESDTANYWELSGHVTDNESVAGLSVVLDGVYQGTAIVAADGTFSLDVYIAAGTMGAITATVTDGDGLESEVVYAWIMA